MGEQRKGLALHWKMMVGFVTGLCAGLLVHLQHWGASPAVTTLMHYGTEPLGTLFLRLIFMLVLPLLFSALVVGIAEMGDIKALGRVGGRTLLYTAVVSTIAVVVGLVFVNVVKPGAGVDAGVARTMLAEGADRAGAIVGSNATQPGGFAMLLSIVPKNPIAAAASDEILSVMFFALMVGVGLMLVKTEATKALLQAIQGLFEISMALIDVVIQLAPYAVFCFMFNLAALFGWDLLARLGAYVAVVLGGLAFQMFVVYTLALKFVGHYSPVKFFRGAREAILMAFATASSNATLPTALEVAERDLHLPPRISRFVLTVGATANQNGTALFEGVTVLFLAQFFGVELALADQLKVMFVCVLGGIGTAGVPAGSLPVVAMICGMVGVPPEGIGLILGVDRLLDMSRTTLNVTGDLVAAAVVSRGA